jgi:uncharacterized protein involved in exopolysaccharide biosynthesis
LKQTIVGVPKRLATEDLTQLHLHKVHESELLAKFGENHPQVLAVRAQIKQAQKNLAESPEQGNQSTSSNNPTYQTLEQQLFVETSLADSLRGRLKSLSEQTTRLGIEIAALNEHEGHITDLSNNVDQLQANYKANVERLEQARIDQALEDRQISNVNVVQSATLVDRPVGPRKLFVLALGVFVALLNGVGIVVVSEFLRTRTSPKQNEITRPELQAALMQ